MTDLPFERTFRRWCEAERVRWRTVRYRRPGTGGETQAHRLSSPQDPRGCVLVVHGAGNDALFSLTGLFADLLRRRFEVLTFDVDGHGRDSTTRLTEEAAAGSIPAALAVWDESLRELPLHAVGISLGGSLLLHALPALEGRLASAALISAPLRVELSRSAILREIGPRMMRTVWRERSWYGLTGLIPSFGPFRRGLYPLRLGEAAGPGPFGYVEVLNRLLDQLELPIAARATPAPVLLIYGGRDLLVPPWQADRLAELLPASELLLLPRETHLSTPLAPAARARLLGWIEQHHPVNRPAA